MLYWSGLPAGETRQRGVCLAVRSQQGLLKTAFVTTLENEFTISWIGEKSWGNEDTCS